MRLLLITICLLFSHIGFSQLSGRAYYQSKRTVDMSGFGGNDMPEEMKKQIMERMRNFLEKTYILSFNGNESIYKEDEKLNTSEGFQGFGMMANSFTPGDQYKNLDTDQILEEREFFGKQFLINDTIPQLEWKVGKESKYIGEYMAIKATAVKPVDPNDLSMIRRRSQSEEEKKETPSDSTNVEDPFADMEIPEEVVVTAWFTPQIPVKNGPGEYSGLPGLILELNVDRTTVLCSKIIINPKEAVEIDKPSKGTEVSRSEYNEIVKKKTEEMRENFMNRGGRRSGNRRFGG